MDHPESQTPRLIQTLKLCLSDSDELINVLPTLEIFFKEEENDESLPQIISLILGPATQILSISDLEPAILHPFLPLVKQFVSKTLSAISNVLSLNTEEEIIIAETKKHLEICIQVLLDLDSLLAYLSNSNELSVSNVFSVPNNFAEITCEVFTHCQKSKEDYGHIFSAVHSDLTSLFQKCHKVYDSLLTILKEKLNFNCSFQDELTLLIDVLNVLGSMSGCLVHLDTITLVTHWKAYAWLTQTYVADLCSRLDISPVIVCLTRGICSQLSSLADLLFDQKMLSRTVKVTGLFVKVLIKLCENYKGYLGDSHRDVFDCMISLSGYSGHLLSEQGLPPELVTHITTQALAGVAPLLSHLILDPVFVQNFFGFADELQSKSCLVLAGYSNLLVLVLRKVVQLSSKDNEIQDLWLTSDLPLVRTVFKVLQESSESGELFYTFEDDIYANLLGHTAAFVVATCTCDMFPQLERQLMEHLLQPLLFPALFSSDLLCLVARLGSSELCLQLAVVSNDVLSCWPAWDWHRPEWVYVSWTLSRLIPLLSPNHLRIFQSSLPSQTDLVADLRTFLNTPVSDGSVIQFKSTINSFNLIEENVTSPDSGSAFTHCLHQLWQHVAALPLDQPAESSQWFLGLYSAMGKATCCSAESFNNSQLVYILDVLTKSHKADSTLSALVACEFLRALAKKTLANDSNQSLVCSRISSLFKQLMASEKPLAKQSALEVFSYFAHLTKYEQIVPDTVVNNHQLQALITDYFERVPATFTGTPFLQHLHSLQPTFQHKCYVNSKAVRLEEDEQNPCKKLKPSLGEEDVWAALVRIERDLDVLDKYESYTAINPSVLSKVQSVTDKFDRFSKKLQAVNLKNGS